MTRKEFCSKSFGEVMVQLREEHDEVTTLDTLKDYIKEQISCDYYLLSAHLCEAIVNDPNYGESEWYLYDYNMGLLDTPVCITCKEDVEHFVDDDEEKIKCCPFCGRENNGDFEYDDGSDCCAVVCDFNKDGCGGSGGYRPTEKEAIKAWNMRAGD